MNTPTRPAAQITADIARMRAARAETPIDWIRTAIDRCILTLLAELESAERAERAPLDLSRPTPATDLRTGDRVADWHTLRRTGTVVRILSDDHGPRAVIVRWGADEYRHVETATYDADALIGTAGLVVIYRA